MRHRSAGLWCSPSPLTLAQAIIAAVDDTGPGPVLIFGGRSEIGTELALRLAPGATVVLAPRGSNRLTEQAWTIRAAGAAAVHTREFDADDLGAHGPLVDSIIADRGAIGTAVLAFGILGDQARAEIDAAHAVAAVHTDYVAQVSLLTHLAAAMRAAGRGSLVVFASIAGVRVRRANYVYGSAKAGLDGFANGLAATRHRGAGADRAARLRHRADDAGHDGRAAGQQPATGGRRDRACTGQGPAHRLDSLGAGPAIRRDAPNAAVRVAQDATMIRAGDHIQRSDGVGAPAACGGERRK
jgi:NADP-dependent 3-hydroxy acid dehydrogenase YdfG